MIVHTSQIDQASDLVRSLFVKNTFGEPLVVYNITMAECSWLKVRVINDVIFNLLILFISVHD